jgi:hypothetical protein
MAKLTSENFKNEESLVGLIPGYAQMVGKETDNRYRWENQIGSSVLKKHGTKVFLLKWI